MMVREMVENSEYVQAKIYELTKMEREEVVEPEVAPEPEEQFLRFTLSQRIQHVALFTSFILLMLTGIPLLIPKFVVVKKFFLISGTFALR